MVTRLKRGVWWVDLTGVNAYLVDDNGVLTLVDTGMPWHSKQLAKAITTVGDAISDVDRVLLTHYDIDHVGGLGNFEALEATVYVGQADEPHLTGEEKPSWRTHKGLSQRAVDWWRSKPSLPVEAVEDGDQVGSFTAYSTPGHTPGHTVYHSAELSVALLGDLVRESDGGLAVPPWLINIDHGQAKSSVVDAANRLPPFEVACPGHGVPFVDRGSQRLDTCAESVTVRGV